MITKTFPLQKVHAVLAATDKASQRERDLPAHVVVYYAIALGLYMQSSYREVLRCLLEGVQWLLDPAVTLKVAGNSGISQARTRDEGGVVSRPALRERRRQHHGSRGRSRQ